MPSVITGGIPMVTSIAILVLGFLEFLGVTHLIEGTQFGDRKLSYVLMASGGGLLLSTWIISILSDITGASMAKIIVGLMLLAGIAASMYFVSTGITYGSTGQKVGFGFLEVLLGITGLVILRKTFA